MTSSQTEMIQNPWRQQDSQITHPWLLRGEVVVRIFVSVWLSCSLLEEASLIPFSGNSVSPQLVSTLLFVSPQIHFVFMRLSFLGCDVRGFSLERVFFSWFLSLRSCSFRTCLSRKLCLSPANSFLTYLPHYFLLCRREWTFVSSSFPWLAHMRCTASSFDDFGGLKKSWDAMSHCPQRHRIPESLPSDVGAKSSFLLASVSPAVTIVVAAKFNYARDVIKKRRETSPAAHRVCSHRFESQLPISCPSLFFQLLPYWAL